MISYDMISYDMISYDMIAAADAAAESSETSFAGNHFQEFGLRDMTLNITYI